MPLEPLPGSAEATAESTGAAGVATGVVRFRWNHQGPPGSTGATEALSSPGGRLLGGSACHLTEVNTWDMSQSLANEPATDQPYMHLHLSENVV